jgi:hypothetical protein
LAEILQAFFDARLRALIPEISALDVGFVRIRPFGGTFRQPLSLFSGQFEADGFDVTGEICTKWNERESTWRKSGSCQSRIKRYKPGQIVTMLRGRRGV